MDICCSGTPLPAHREVIPGSSTATEEKSGLCLETNTWGKISSAAHYWILVGSSLNCANEGDADAGRARPVGCSSCLQDRSPKP